MALLQVVSLWEELKPPRALLLITQGEAYDCVHRPLSPSKWDHWRDDWVIVQTEVNDRLALPTGNPMGRCSHWEKVLELQRAYDPVLKRIQFLVEQGLTSLMMMFDFLS
jgi:hypothetical protein